MIYFFLKKEVSIFESHRAAKIKLRLAPKATRLFSSLFFWVLRKVVCCPSGPVPGRAD
jgi:hypothetical protein